MVNPDTAREPSKAPMPPIIVKKGKPGANDDDGETTDAPPPKQKILPTGLSRAIVIATVIASVTVAATNLFAARYELVPAPSSANGFMYRIDKLFGSVQFCGPQGCSDLPHPGAAP